MLNEYFDKLAVWLSFNDVILLNVYSNIDKKESHTIDTIGLNTTSTLPVLEYNKTWLESCSYEYFEFMIINELFKLLLKHPTNRLHDPKEVSALASNITVCELTTPDVIKNEFSAEMFGLEPNLHFEAYWKLLQENENGEANTPISGELDEKLQEYLDPTNNSNDNWGENGLIDETLATIVKEAKGNQKNWGKLTGELYEDIVANYTLRIDPMSVLRHFKASINTLESIPSRMKINRRYGLAMPGRRRKQKSKVLVAIDVSGSMTNEMVADGMKLINSVIQKSSIEFVTFDTKLTSEVIKTQKTLKTININGRGGTDITCVLKFIKQSKVKYDGLIVYSDNYYPEVNIQPRNIKCLWFGCKGATASPQRYGYHLQLDEI
jgi:predicted metal-dependent peptidase